MWDYESLDSCVASVRYNGTLSSALPLKISIIGMHCSTIIMFHIVKLYACGIFTESITKESTIKILLCTQVIYMKKVRKQTQISYKAFPSVCWIEESNNILTKWFERKLQYAFDSPPPLSLSPHLSVSLYI